MVKWQIESPKTKEVWGAADSFYLYILNREGNKTTVKDGWKIARYKPKAEEKNADRRKMARKDGWDRVTRCTCVVSSFSMQLIYFMTILVIQLKCYDLITSLGIQITFLLLEAINQVLFYTSPFYSIKNKVKCTQGENERISVKGTQGCYLEYFQKIKL